MKKTIKSIMAVLVVLTLCVGLLAGCGGNSPVGTWKISGAEAMGSSISPSEMGDSANVTLTFNADGTMTSNGETGGKWELNGNTLKLTENGMTIECEYDGKNIVINMGIAKMIYSRA